MPKGITRKEFIQKSINKFGCFLDYKEVEYKNSASFIFLICPIHNKFKTTPSRHLNSKHPCPKCSKSIPTTQEFISRVQEAQKNNTLRFEKTIYVKNNQKVVATCIYHGDFLTLPGTLLKGAGCIKCCGSEKKSNASFIDKSNKIHNNKYTYSNCNYINNNTKVIITCPVHGDFEQLPTNHYKYGCITCSGKFKKTTQEFIDEANVIHNNKYNYSKVTYNNAFSKIQVICTDHGPWKTDPSNHLAGKGCPKCSRRVSKGETKWLDKLGINNRNVYLNIDNKKFFVDGFDPNTNTIYEFYGDYWHGNPDIYDLNAINKATKTTFRYLYNKTLRKESLLKKAGYNIISIWESNWNAQDKNDKNNTIR